MTLLQLEAAVDDSVTTDSCCWWLFLLVVLLVNVKSPLTSTNATVLSISVEVLSKLKVLDVGWQCHIWLVLLTTLFQLKAVQWHCHSRQVPLMAMNYLLLDLLIQHIWNSTINKKRSYIERILKFYGRQFMKMMMMIDTHKQFFMTLSE